ncbi:MAG: hypothetical protein KDD62_15715, partial [Bdellovibrionales bacterium]|nr:hypothetical protein [Bdellovibrionales bacterium]
MVSRVTRITWWVRSNFFHWILPVFILGLSVLGSLAYLQRPQADSPLLASHILIFGIVNFNLVLLLLLVFLVGRNIVKLIFDRRKNILGSRLRARLVVVFVSLAMVPSLIVCVLATGLLTQAMQGWFSGHVEGAAEGAIGIAQSYYAEQKKESRRITSEVSRYLKNNPLQVQPDIRQATFERKRTQYGLFDLRMVDPSGKLIVEASHVTASIDGFALPPVSPSGLARSLEGDLVVLFEEAGQGLYVRTYALTIIENESFVVIATSRIDPKLSHSLHLVNESYREYAQLKLFRMPLQTSYVLTLLMITGLILFAAVWVGFFIAREITGPIQRLAEATEEVARGNYDIQVTAKG